MGADKRMAPAPEARGRGRDSCEPATDLETTSSSIVGLEPTYAIATPQGDGPSERWDPGTITFAEYVLRAENPADRKQCGGLLAGTLAGGRKRREDVLTRSMATLDADDAEPELLEAVRGLGVQALLHSTWRHTLEAPRYRVVLPYRREVTAAEHAHVSRVLMDVLGLEQFDPRSAYPEQFMYWPATSDPNQYVVEAMDGPLLDPDEYLARPLPEVPSQRPQEPAGRPSASPTAPASPRARAYVGRAVRGALEELEQTAAMPEGARDDRGRSWESGGTRGGGLLRAHACRLVELSNLDPEGYPLEQAERDYLEHAPAGERGRFARHWSSALEHVGERAADLTEEDYSGMQLEVIDDRARGLEGEDPEVGHDEQDRYARAVAERVLRLRIDREARSIVDAGAAPEVPPTRSLADLLAEPDEDVQWLVDGLLPRGERVLWVGPTKSGKTTGRDNLVRSLVDGTPFLGRHAVEEVEEGVALLDFELGEGMLRRWLRTQRIEHPDRVDVYALRGQGSAFNILLPAVRSAWADRLRGRRVLVVDCLRPLADALGLDENRELSKILNALDELIAKAGMSEWIALHHTGWVGEHGRGDSGAEGTAGVIWRTVREDPDKIDSPRYFSAFGREVDAPEALLSFDPSTHALTIGGGSRRETKVAAAVGQVLEVLPVAGESEALSQRSVESLLEGKVPRNVARAALQQAVQDGLIVISQGPRNARLHALPARREATE